MKEKYRVGEAWKIFIEKGGYRLWFNPEGVDKNYFLRLNNSEYIKKITYYIRPIISENLRFLEAGCGTGVYSICLSIRGYKIEAFDYNENILRLACETKKKAEVFFHNLDISFAQADILNTPYKDKSFDMVFNQSVSEYFINKNERSTLLREMTRVAKRSGYVVIIVRNLKAPFNIYKNRIEPVAFEYNARLLEEEMKRAGLKDVITDGIYPWHCFFKIYSKKGF